MGRTKKSPEEKAAAQAAAAKAKAAKAAAAKKAEAPAGQPAAGIPEDTFEIGDKEYKFVVPKFKVPGFILKDEKGKETAFEGGEMTAAEAINNDPVCIYLVQEKAGVIEEVK